MWRHVAESGVVARLFRWRRVRRQFVQRQRAAGERFEQASGDLTGDSARLLWTHKESASYVPTPVLHDGRLYFLRDSTGMLNCLDAKTGQVVFARKRLGLGRTQASPIVAQGRIYVCGRDGATIVIQADRQGTILKTNRLDATFDASPVALARISSSAAGKTLYCVSDQD